MTTAPPNAAARPGRRPNIIFIVADDLGYADLGCYGGRAPVSPVLDRLAAGGMLFTQGYSNSPVCSPTRFALMTGRWQYRLRGAADEPINSRSRGSAIARPAAGAADHRLAAARDGYRTALIGKWHLGYPPHFGPLRSGYEEFFGPMSGGVDYFTHCSGSGDHDLWEGEAEKHEPGYLTDLLSRRAVDYVERMADDSDAAVLPQPALHRAALAVGDARRRGAGRGGQEEPVPPARRQHPHLPPHDPPHGRGHRPTSSRRCAAAACSTTR